MKSHFRSKRLCLPAERAAFTLVELCIVIATVTVLALLAVPALSTARVPANAMICQNNLRQLTAGWALYSAENKDKVCQTGGMDILITDPSDPKSKAGGPYANWVLGSMISIPGNTDERFIKNGLLFPYVNDVKLYKCPVDSRTEDFPMNYGRPTLRSYSMNCFMNPVHVWLSDVPGKTTNFRRQSDVTRPAATFLVIEENPGSINDGWFTTQGPFSWADIPATYHNQAANISFADGHIESKKWTDPALLQTNITSFGSSSQDPDRKDLHWLTDRATY